MFTWICPKCGKEVPPSYDECPNCAATMTGTAETPKAAEPVAPAPSSPPPAQPRAATPAKAKSPGLPAWAMTLLFAAAFIAIGAGLFTVLRSRSGDQKAQAATANQTQEPRLPDAAAVKAHPLLKNLEVTGLRLTEDAKQKATVRFVLVNHSAADIAGLTAKAKILAVNAGPDDLPMGTFSFKTDLGPYESKDLSVPLETKLRAYELPDWQFIRADLQIVAP